MKSSYNNLTPTLWSRSCGKRDSGIIVDDEQWPNKLWQTIMLVPTPLQRCWIILMGNWPHKWLPTGTFGKTQWQFGETTPIFNGLVDQRKIGRTLHAGLLDTVISPKRKQLIYGSSPYLDHQFQWGIRGTADSLPCHGRDSQGSTDIPRHFNCPVAQLV